MRRIRETFSPKSPPVLSPDRKEWHFKNHILLLFCCYWFSFFVSKRCLNQSFNSRLNNCKSLWLVEYPLRGMGAWGHRFDSRPWHTEVVKNGTSCSSFGTQTYGVELGLDWPSVRIMWLSVVSCMILQWGSTIKVSIELLVATRHWRDMTYKLLKAMLNQNKQINL